MQPLVTASHLSKQFNDVIAVDDLSFTVNKGDVYGFLGQNGAGKSTSLRMLLTLITLGQGKIEVFGKDLRHHRHEILSRIGAVIERPDLYKYLSAYKNLELFAQMSGISPDRKRLMQQLEKVGLASRADSKVKTYSQGMKQRLGIAVALVHDPELIILDEPTNGLDPQGIADIRNLIIHLSKDLGKTVIVSSHLLHEIEQVANRMIIIHKGRKVVEGNVTELFNPDDMLLEMEVVNVEETMIRLADSGWRERLQETRWNKLLFRLSKNEIIGFNKEMAAAGVDFLSIAPRHSLEDYFLQLTSEKHVETFTH